MIPIKNKRKITINSIKAIPFVTDLKPKKEVILTKPNGKSIHLKSHQITKDLLKFVEDICTVQIQDYKEGHRGKSEIAGVAVEVQPINHTNYDGGAYIFITEENNRSMENTNKITKYLRKKGIDMDQFCQVAGRDISCMDVIDNSTIESDNL